jgi:hypothetical protein
MRRFATAAVLTVATLGLVVTVQASPPSWSHAGGNGDHGGNGSVGGNGGSDNHPGNNGGGNGNQGGNGSQGVHGRGTCVRACMSPFHSCQSTALSAFKACFQPCAALQDAITQACGQGDGVTGSDGGSEGDGVTGSEGQDDGDTEPEGDGVTNNGPSAACEQAIQAFQDCIHGCQATFQTDQRGCLQTAHTCANQCGIPAASVPTPHH